MLVSNDDSWRVAIDSFMPAPKPSKSAGKTLTASFHHHQRSASNLDSQYSSSRGKRMELGISVEENSNELLHSASTAAGSSVRSTDDAANSASSRGSDDGKKTDPHVAHQDGGSNLFLSSQGIVSGTTTEGGSTGRTTPCPPSAATNNKQMQSHNTAACDENKPTSNTSTTGMHHKRKKASSTVEKKRAGRLISMAVAEMVTDHLILPQHCAAEEAELVELLVSKLQQIDADDFDSDDDDDEKASQGSSKNGSTTSSELIPEVPLSSEEKADRLRNILRFGATHKAPPPCACVDPNCVDSVANNKNGVASSPPPPPLSSVIYQLMSMRLCTTESILIALTYLQRACFTASAAKGTCSVCGGVSRNASYFSTAFRPGALAPKAPHSNNTNTHSICDACAQQHANKKGRTLSGSSNKSCISATSYGLSDAQSIVADDGDEQNQRTIDSLFVVEGDADEDETNDQHQASSDFLEVRARCQSTMSHGKDQGVDREMHTLTAAELCNNNYDLLSDDILPPFFDAPGRPRHSSMLEVDEESPRVVLTPHNVAFFFVAAVMIAAKTHDDEMCHPKYFAKLLKHTDVSLLSVAERALCTVLGYDHLLASSECVEDTLHSLAAQISSSSYLYHEIKSMEGATASSIGLGSPLSLAAQTATMPEAMVHYTSGAQNPITYADHELIAPVLVRVFSNLRINVSALVIAIIGSHHPLGY